MAARCTLTLLASPALALAAALAAPPLAAQSLYNEATFRSLTADRRAHRVGDVLTVLVYENASASASADTTSEKSGGFNVGLRNNARNESLGLSAGSDSTGRGKIQRTGRLAAQISVNVDGVTANGDLWVSGQQEILVNGEKQLIRLSGRVRPIDVNEVNAVASTRIADASITYVGDGILAEKQRQGLLSRVLTWLGLI